MYESLSDEEKEALWKSHGLLSSRVVNDGIEAIERKCEEFKESMIHKFEKVRDKVIDFSIETAKKINYVIDDINEYLNDLAKTIQLNVSYALHPINTAIDMFQGHPAVFGVDVSVLTTEANHLQTISSQLTTLMNRVDNVL